MNRRGFITLVSRAVLVWPIAARAQQPERVRLIGALMGLNSQSQLGQQQYVALRKGLEELGWVVGRNVRIEDRWLGGQPGRAQLLARELVALRPDVLALTPQWQRPPCYKRRTPYRWCSSTFLIPSAPGSSQTWRDLPVTLPA